MNDLLKRLGVVLMAVMVVGCGDAQREGSAAHSADRNTGVSAVRIPPPRNAANVFYSGHSLMDQPLPDFVRRIAESLGHANQWNRQYVVGSSIQRRTHGVDPAVPGWQGYRQGYNREGEGLDVIAELREPKTINGSYDVLVITEEHTMLEILLLGDTVRLLRHYHDRFIEGNPSGTTYFYEPWLAIEDKSDPRRWIAYERAASRIWQCVATRINAALEVESRADRLISLPAGIALAELVERATQGDGVPGITRGNVRETVDTLFADDVHLRPLGMYYMALVVYASVYRHSPQGAWHPEDVTVQQATVLQDIAWEFVTRYYDNYQPLSLQACRAQLLSNGNGGLAFLWGYVRDVVWRPEIGVLHGYARFARRLIKSRRAFASDTSENPFHFDASADAGYWLPPP
jgi:hypothetical protein